MAFSSCLELLSTEGVFTSLPMHSFLLFVSLTAVKDINMVYVTILYTRGYYCNKEYQLQTKSVIGHFRRDKMFKYSLVCQNHNNPVFKRETTCDPYSAITMVYVNI